MKQTLKNILSKKSTIEIQAGFIMVKVKTNARRRSSYSPNPFLQLIDVCSECSRNERGLSSVVGTK